MLSKQYCFLVQADSFSTFKSLLLRSAVWCLWGSTKVSLLFKTYMQWLWARPPVWQTTQEQSSTQLLLIVKSSNQNSTWFGPASGLLKEEENKLGLSMLQRENKPIFQKISLIFPVYKSSRQGKYWIGGQSNEAVEVEKHDFRCYPGLMEAAAFCWPR